MDRWSPLSLYHCLVGFHATSVHPDDYYAMAPMQVGPYLWVLAFVVDNEVYAVRLAFVVDPLVDAYRVH